jgi:hypothetical protein
LRLIYYIFQINNPNITSVIKTLLGIQKDAVYNGRIRLSIGKKRLSYHMVAVLHLKAYGIMYTIDNFLFICLAMNVLVFAVKFNLTTLTDSTVQQNTVELISENWRHTKEILNQCPYKYNAQVKEKQCQVYLSNPETGYPSLKR